MGWPLIPEEEEERQRWSLHKSQVETDMFCRVEVVAKMDGRVIGGQWGSGERCV